MDHVIFICCGKEVMQNTDISWEMSGSEYGEENCSAEVVHSSSARELSEMIKTVGSFVSL